MPAIIHFTVDKASLDLKHPWKSLNPRSSTGTGFYIGQRLIVTNCHVIKDATSIRLMRNGQPGTFKGRVLCQSELCDLALVTVDAAPTFWERLPQIEFQDEVPALGDAVIAVGYPLGAKSVTITRGVVSGVSMADLSLTHRNPKLLRIQIDAAINPGNSGGPVLDIETKRVVGVAFSSVHTAQSMSFIIPMAVVRLFRQRYEMDGRANFGMLPETGFLTSELVNESHRRFYLRDRFDDADGAGFGCLVTYVEKFSAASTRIRIGDVLLAVDGHRVSETGEVLFRAHEWLSYDYLITTKMFGECARLRLLRRGETEADAGRMVVIDVVRPFTH